MEEFEDYESQSGVGMSNLALGGVVIGLAGIVIGGTCLVVSKDAVTMRDVSNLLIEVGIHVSSLPELKSALINYGALLLLSGGLVTVGSWLVLRSASLGSER